MHESSFTEMEEQQILEAEQEIMSSLSCMLFGVACKRFKSGCRVDSCTCDSSSVGRSGLDRKFRPHEDIGLT